MTAQPFSRARSAFSRRALSGSSLIVLAGSAAVLAARDSMAADMIVDGQRFIPLEGARYDISPHSETAVVASKQGNLIAKKGEYEVFGDLLYVSEDLAMAQFAQAAVAGAGAGSSIIPFGISGWGLVPILGIPALGVAGATLWHYLSPGVLRFANEGKGSTFENSTEVTYDASVVNQERGSNLTYSLTGDGDDDGLFTIDPVTGVLTFLTAPNFEDPSDINDDNIYDIEVEVTDGEQTAFQTVAVTVQNLDETPSWVSGAAGTAVEKNTDTSYVAEGFDEDAGAVLSYRLTGNGPDDDLFVIDDETGVLRFRNAPDFESPTDDDSDNDYQVQIAVSDTLNTAVRDVTITVSNENEAPVFVSGTSGTMDENGTTTSYTADATDVDAGDNQTYSIIVTGDDDQYFSIDPNTGVLSLNGALDFENPNDANGDGDYEFSILVTDDGGLTDQLDLSITLVDVDEAPVFENAGPFAVQENALAATAVGDVNANDGDTGATDANINYSITGGTGAGLFSINPSTGEVTVTNGGTLDRETTASYTLEVTAQDANNVALTTAQTYTINITDENEAPAFTSPNTLSIPENSTAPTLQAVVDDPEGDGITWSISGGVDAGLFSISATGELSIDATKDFETPVDDDMDNQYVVNLRADDGNGNQTDQVVTVSITDVNEAPVFTTGTTASQNENTTVTGYDADATDPENNGLTYSIIGTGADDALFSIDGVSGVLSFQAAPDADIAGDANGNNIYEVAIRVSDGTSNVDQTVFVTVNDINEAPVVTSGGSISVIENNLTTGYVATSTDVDGDTPTYSIAGTGDDDADFGIDGVSGALSFLVAPDFETPSSLDGDNVYEVDILVSDGGLTDTQTVLVTITNENEDPTLGASGTTNVQENLLATGFTASATDPDAGASQVYALAADTPTNDNSLFQIDSGSGVLSFLVAPDFETPASYLASNTYTVDVEVTDTLGGSDSETYFIAVTDDPLG